MIHIEPLDLTNTPLAERVLDIQRRAYAIEAALIGFNGIPPLHESLAELQATPDRFLGAYLDDALVGAIAYEYELAGTTLDITRMVVDPDYHRRGIGRALLMAIFALDPVAPTYTVSTGSANAPAIALYMGMGFVVDRQERLGEGVWITHLVKR